ncbi:zf-HC2 domain-containing protein [Tumebacillus permanentifrigoris]|uniref:Anti-sigma-W factor RsiW n=1 Tax=Tumebacillus permanentifrigoris TaxID=378543 RepID=A0A316DE71_9BACL|nr:zf-HC2 domain-containing protein [Tumebacillus permanentifrigoris]PWK16006.1 anti-sigma factor RsiW [Tumebacillus permanentifrigoris]
MTHDSYREFIQRELDGDLSAEETAWLDQHIASCAACRTERQEYHQLSEGLMSMKAVLPDRSFVSQMEFDFDELLRPQSPPTPLQKKGRRRIPSGWWQGLSVAAAVVLAIGFTYNFLPSGTATHTAQPDTTTDTPAPVVALGDEHRPPTTPDSSTKPADAPTANVENQKTPSTEPKQPAGTKVASSLAGSSTQPTTGSSNPATVNSKPPISADTTTTTGTASNSKPTTSKPETETPASSGSPHGGTGTIVAVGPSQEHGGQGIVPALKDRDRFYGQTAGALAAEQPPLPMIVGTIDHVPSELDEHLQDQVRLGNPSARWGTIPTQVVQHVLTEIGFAAISSVHETTHPDRVDVVQGGQTYRVRLMQPFEAGANGIWQPVQISRELSLQSLEPTDKPIIEYFNQMTQERQFTIVSLHVEENLLMNRTVVGADLILNTEAGPRQAYFAYTFRLKLNQDFSWSLDGKPIVRH